MNLVQFPARVPVARLQIFVSDLSATGVVRNAVAIANRAAASGYDVRLLTCRAGGVMGGKVDPRVAIVELLASAEPGSSRRSQLKQSFLAYRRHSRAWRPHILLSAGNHGHLLSSFAWLGLPGSKVLRISNDLCHGAPSPLARLWRRLKFRMVTALAHRLVLVSRSRDRDRLLSRCIASGKAVVVPNGVDVQAIQNASLEPCPHPWARDGDVPLLLAVGRHVRQKNFLLLLRAFAAARRKQAMRLIILGEGMPGETLRLHNLAVSLGVSADVQFVAPTDNPFPYMAAARALVLPSLWEGSSNVLLEALACGTPVIASRTAGDAEQILSRGRFGLLVDPSDEEGIADALLRQVGPDPVVPGNRAVAFGLAVTLGNYMQLFDHLAGSRARDRGVTEVPVVQAAASARKAAGAIQ